MINIYILQPPFWVSLIFYFFHWNAQVSVKVSMISVLGKIKEMCLVLYLSKKCVRVGFISDHYLFQLKTEKYVYFFAFIVVFRSFRNRRVKLNYWWISCVYSIISI